MDSRISAPDGSWKILGSALSVALVGCFAGIGDEDSPGEGAPDASSGLDDDATGWVPEIGRAAATYGPLPSASTPSVGFRATFHSMDTGDPDFDERREGGRV